jgi:hypothetical protein
MKNLSSHDGLHDSLTGALTLLAFYEAVEREIARAGREIMSLHLLLLKLPLPIGNSSANSETTRLSNNQMSEELLLVQLIELVHELKSSLRNNDLISRTGLSEISIVFSGNAKDLKKRIIEIASRYSAEIAMVQYQENWKLPEFLMVGDIALKGIVTEKNDATNLYL